MEKYYICIIDEIAELMLNFPKETEDFFRRITMMGRIAGIYLIISTKNMPEVMTPLVRITFKNLLHIIFVVID